MGNAISAVKLFVALIAFCALGVSVLTYALLSQFVVVSNFATVKTVGVEVYWNPNATQLVANIDWGIVEPNSTVEKTVYMKNLGNVPVTLNLTTKNWNPANASNFILLSWNYTGFLVDPDLVVPVVLTLSISAEISGIESFSFDIIIRAEG